MDATQREKMVERVAMAIHAAQPARCTFHWKDVTPGIKSRYRMMAQAAILATWECGLENLEKSQKQGENESKQRAKET